MSRKNVFSTLIGIAVVFILVFAVIGLSSGNDKQVETRQYVNPESKAEITQTWRVNRWSSTLQSYSGTIHLVDLPVGYKAGDHAVHEGAPIKLLEVVENNKPVHVCDCGEYQLTLESDGSVYVWGHDTLKGVIAWDSTSALTKILLKDNK